jgi:acyl-CoA reductase-like NAD-dependent aldehyde dehydrogenase
LAAAFDELTLGPGIDDHDVGPLASQAQFERVSRHVETARRTDGARLIRGGAGEGLFFEPTIFDVTDPSCPIANEEVFGPVLAVIPFRDEAEAVALANGAGYDLAAAVWSQDIDRAFRVARQIRAGQVHINSYGIGDGVALPFGGIRFSGIGREKGLRALDEYSALRTTTVRVAA